MKMKKKLLKGFTMIELLIVIAVLGILAVAVLSAINPIEQINRSRDTGSRSDAEQLIGAVDRFYATQGYYPWQFGADDAAGEPQAWLEVDMSWMNSADPAVSVLDLLSGGDGGDVGTGEVKASFIDRISKTTYNTLYVYNEGVQGSSTYVCFSPKSASFMKDAADRCVSADGLPEDFPLAEACVADDEYSCLP